MALTDSLHGAEESMIRQECESWQNFNPNFETWGRISTPVPHTCPVPRAPLKRTRNWEEEEGGVRSATEAAPSIVPVGGSASLVPPCSRFSTAVGPCSTAVGPTVRALQYCEY
eukprot:2886358-Rhodomonas_salina.2